MEYSVRMLNDFNHLWLPATDANREIERLQGIIAAQAYNLAEKEILIDKAVERIVVLEAELNQFKATFTPSFCTA